jgi:hypothetical protein
VVWALGGVDEQGRHRPFNAIGVFVRLLSASGDGSTVGFATHDAHPDGRYDAQVVVPKGGIGGVRIGLRGSSDAGASDARFPLENDPFAAPARRVAVGQEATSGRPVPSWPALAGVLALLGHARGRGLASALGDSSQLAGAALPSTQDQGPLGQPWGQSRDRARTRASMPSSTRSRPKANSAFGSSGSSCSKRPDVTRVCSAGNRSASVSFASRRP